MFWVRSKRRVDRGLAQARALVSALIVCCLAHTARAADDPPEIADLMSHIAQCQHADDPDQLEEATFFQRCMLTLRAITYCNWSIAAGAVDSAAADEYRGIAVRQVEILRTKARDRLNQLAATPSESAPRKILIEYLAKSIDELRVFDARSATPSGDSGTIIGGGQSKTYRIADSAVDDGPDAIVIRPSADPGKVITVPKSLLQGIAAVQLPAEANLHIAPSPALHGLAASLAAAERLIAAPDSKVNSLLACVHPDDASAVLSLVELAARDREAVREADSAALVARTRQVRELLAKEAGNRLREGRTLDLSAPGLRTEEKNRLVPYFKSLSRRMMPAGTGRDAADRTRGTVRPAVERTNPP